MASRPSRTPSRDFAGPARAFERDGRIRVGQVRYLAGADDGEIKILADRGSKRGLVPDPSTVAGPELWVVEGEGDLLSAATIELPAVSLPGAIKPRGEWAAQIAARRERVVLICDSDRTGREAADSWAGAIAEHCADVRVVDLHPDRDNKGDLSTFLADAHSDDDRRCARTLLQRVADGTAPVRSPAAEGAAPPLRLRTGLQIRTNTPERPPYVWDGYLARGAVTLLSGSPKAWKVDSRPCPGRRHRPRKQGVPRTCPRPRPGSVRDRRG